MEKSNKSGYSIADGAHHLKLASGLAIALQNIVTPRPQAFLHHLCRLFIHSAPGPHSIFEKLLREVGDLRSCLQKHGHVVLNVYSYANEY